MNQLPQTDNASTFPHYGANVTPGYRSSKRALAPHVLQERLQALTHKFARTLTLQFEMTDI
jgi:hypothetical protein